MQKQEFEKLVGYEVADSVYSEIEAAYMAAGEMDKETFCKEFKEHQLNKSEVFWEIIKTLAKTKSDADFYGRQFDELKGKMEKQLEEKGLRWNDDDEVLEEVPAYERIKTLQDAEAVTGMKFKEIWKELPTDVQAYLRLRIICAAMNGLTEETYKDFPKFEPGERVYYPWHYIYESREKAKAAGWEDDELCDIPALVGCANPGDHCGVSLLHSHLVASNTAPNSGGALVMRDRARAIYCGKQFIADWMEFKTKFEVKR